MQKKHFILVIFILIVGSFQIVKSQSTVSIDFLTLGVHPFEKPNLKLFENALDANGNVCTKPGIAISYEAFISENRVSFQFTTGFLLMLQVN
jgi:hypothetical protein